MEIKPIRDEKTYREALREIAVLVETDPALGTPEGDRLEVPLTLEQRLERFDPERRGGEVMDSTAVGAERW